MITPDQSVWRNARPFVARRASSRAVQSQLSQAQLSVQYDCLMRLVEENSGIGELLLDGIALRGVRYHLRRFQGFLEGSGMPIPGLHRIEGSIDFDPDKDPAEWIGTTLGLKLEDGRVFGIMLTGNDGRILSEGHGPTRCLCC